MNPISIGAALTGLAVILGAFGTHGLQGKIGYDLLDIYKTGTYYLLVHALGLILFGMSKIEKLWPAWCFGIGSLIFRDEEKMISDAPDPKAMYAIIYPYEGALEMWYQQHASLYTDFMIIFLTGWSILFPRNKLVHKVFKGLPLRDF